MSLPTPPGWSRKQNAKLPATTVVIGKGDTFPRAVLAVFKLTGDFVNSGYDPAEAVKHGLVETELQPNFHRLEASTADYQGFPSAMVQGSHDLNGQRLHSWFRMVLPIGGPPSRERYLVQLSVISLADPAAAEAAAADAKQIMDGFVVAAK